MNKSNNLGLSCKKKKKQTNLKFKKFPYKIGVNASRENMLIVKSVFPTSVNSVYDINTASTWQPPMFLSLSTLVLMHGRWTTWSANTRFRLDSETKVKTVLLHSDQYSRNKYKVVGQ